MSYAIERLPALRSRMSTYEPAHIISSVCVLCLCICASHIWARLTFLASSSNVISGKAYLSGQFLKCDLAVCKIFAVPHQLRTRFLLASLLDFLPLGVPFRMSLSGALVLDEYMTASHLLVQGNPGFRFDSHTRLVHLLASHKLPHIQSGKMNCNTTCTASAGMDANRV